MAAEARTLSFEEAMTARKHDFYRLVQLCHEHPWKPEDHGQTALFFDGAFRGFVRDDDHIDQVILTANRGREFLRTHASLAHVVGTPYPTTDPENVNLEACPSFVPRESPLYGLLRTTPGFDRAWPLYQIVPFDHCWLVVTDAASVQPLQQLLADHQPPVRVVDRLKLRVEE